MGLRISTNMAALVAQRSLKNNSDEQKKVFQRLASGDRITSAGDDAAGLSISENLRAQIRSISQADRNANDGISLVQVAEGGMTEVANILVRLRELSIQAASDTIGDRERQFVDQEVQSLVQEVDRIAQVTNFNGTPLLTGDSDKSELSFQVGIRNDEADQIVFNINENNVQASEIGIEGMSVESIESAREGLDQVDQALEKISATRATLGAMQNKLQATSNNLTVSRENLQHANSRIRDTDVAHETSELTRRNILNATGIAILSQANSAPNVALRLVN